MSLDYPSFDDLSAQIIAEFRVQLPGIDPTVFGTWALSFANGNAVLAQSISLLVRDLEKQLFPQTATDELLDLWGEYESLSRLPETPAFGNTSLDDTTVPVTTVIPALTNFTGSNGIIYQSTAVSTIIAVNQAIATLVRVGNIAFAVLASEHQLATGMEVTTSGATEPEYNGTFVVTVTSASWFSYTVSGTPSTPATGSPVYDVNLASIAVEAQSVGTDTNLSSGAQMTNDTYGTALVQFEGLTGGASEETDDEYRERILLSRSIREGVFTPDQIKLAVFSINGNTRAWVNKPTSGAGGGASDPLAGQTSVFFLRDNDPSITPSAAIITETKQAIIDDGAMPANMVEADLFVQGPTLVATAFDFDALSPDTPTMRTAVENALQAFFDDSVEFEETVTQDAYRGAIQNTQDLETGDFISTFNLTAPLADIVITSGQLGTLDAVTWSI